MSFNNEDDKDGLAALFGGITPQGAPAPDPAPRRAAAPPPAAPSPAAPSPAVTPSPAADNSAPRYPGLEPSAPAAPAAPAAGPPAYSPPGSQPPAAPPVTPAFARPSFAPPSFAPPTFAQPAPPAYQPPAYQPPASPGYDLPAPEATPSAPPAYEPPAYQPPAYQPPTYQPPAYQPPVSEPPAPTPTEAAPFGAPASPGYDLPAPTTEHTRPVDPAPYPGLAPSAPAYPATAPYSTAMEAPGSGAAPPPSFPADPAAPPAYEPPTRASSSYDPPTGYPVMPDPAAPEPARAPEPLSEPPAYGGGFESLGLRPPAEGPEAVQPSFPAAPEQPIAASAAVEPAPRREGSAPVLRLPPGPLLPAERAAPIVAPEDLARSTPLEKVGLALAVLTGPIGLVLAIVTAILGLRRRGWVIGIARASLALAVISTIVAAIGGVVLWNLRVAQLEHSTTAAASAEFCAAGLENPELVERPYLGWPAPGATITESLESMQEWTTRWTDLAATSPAELGTGMELLASTGQEIIAAVETSRLVDDTANKALIGSVVTPSGVVNWYDTYCVAP